MLQQAVFQIHHSLSERQLNVSDMIVTGKAVQGEGLLRTETPPAAFTEGLKQHSPLLQAAQLSSPDPACCIVWGPIHGTYIFPAGGQQSYSGDGENVWG